MKTITSVAIMWMLFALPADAAESTNSNTSSVLLAWDANTEPDIAGYRVHLGTSPKRPTIKREAGITTNLVWEGLVPGVTNYFSVTAFNTAGLESEYSDEVMFALSTVPSKTTNIVGIVTQVITTVSQTITNTFTVRPTQGGL